MAVKKRRGLFSCFGTDVTDNDSSVMLTSPPPYSPPVVPSRLTTYDEVESLSSSEPPRDPPAFLGDDLPLVPATPLPPDAEPTLAPEPTTLTMGSEEEEEEFSDAESEKTPVIHQASLVYTMEPPKRTPAPATAAPAAAAAAAAVAAPAPAATPSYSARPAARAGIVLFGGSSEDITLSSPMHAPPAQTTPTPILPGAGTGAGAGAGAGIALSPELMEALSPESMVCLSESSSSSSSSDHDDSPIILSPDDVLSPEVLSPSSTPAFDTDFDVVGGTVAATNNDCVLSAQTPSPCPCPSPGPFLPRSFSEPPTPSPSPPPDQTPAPPPAARPLLPPTTFFAGVAAGAAVGDALGLQTALLRPSRARITPPPTLTAAPAPGAYSVHAATTGASTAALAAALGLPPPPAFDTQPNEHRDLPNLASAVVLSAVSNAATYRVGGNHHNPCNAGDSHNNMMMQGVTPAASVLLWGLFRKPCNIVDNSLAGKAARAFFDAATTPCPAHLWDESDLADSIYTHAQAPPRPPPLIAADSLTGAVTHDAAAVVAAVAGAATLGSLRQVTADTAGTTALAITAVRLYALPTALALNVQPEHRSAAFLRTVAACTGLGSYGLRAASVAGALAAGVLAAAGEVPRLAQLWGTVAGANKDLAQLPDAIGRYLPVTLASLIPASPLAPPPPPSLPTPALSLATSSRMPELSPTPVPLRAVPAPSPRLVRSSMSAGPGAGAGSAPPRARRPKM